MQKVLIPILAIALCAGCSVFGPAVPHTKATFKLGNQEFTLDSPKQVGATNVLFRVETNGTVTVQIGSFSSVNDPLVIDKSYAGQIMLVKQWGDTGTQLLNAGGNLAMKAMSTTNSPSVLVVTNAVSIK